MDETLSTVVEQTGYAIRELAHYVQTYAPQMFDMVRNRVMVESVFGVSAWFIILILFVIVLSKCSDTKVNDDVSLAGLTGVVLLVALVVSLIWVIPSMLNLFSLDYAAMERIIKVATQ
jgi:hypothetical protein